MEGVALTGGAAASSSSSPGALPKYRSNSQDLIMGAIYKVRERPGMSVRL
mgnify:CR=1 FL=1